MLREFYQNSQVLQDFSNTFWTAAPFIGWVVILIVGWFTLIMLSQASRSDASGTYVYILECMEGTRTPFRGWHLFVVGFWIGIVILWMIS